MINLTLDSSSDSKYSFSVDFWLFFLIKYSERFVRILTCSPFVIIGGPYWFCIENSKFFILAFKSSSWRRKLVFSIPRRFFSSKSCIRSPNFCQWVPILKSNSYLSVNIYCINEIGNYKTIPISSMLYGATIFRMMGLIEGFWRTLSDFSTYKSYRGPLSSDHGTFKLDYFTIFRVFSTVEFYKPWFLNAVFLPLSVKDLTRILNGVLKS